MAAAKKPLTEFSQLAIAAMKKIPRGRVATYGQIAIIAKNPGGARRVNWLLHACTKTHKIPWQRVVGAKGKIAIPEDSMGNARQRRLLQAEGVEFMENGRIDMDRYQWRRGLNEKAKPKRRR